MVPVLAVPSGSPVLNRGSAAATPSSLGVRFSADRAPSSPPRWASADPGGGARGERSVTPGNEAARRPILDNDLSATAHRRRRREGANLKKPKTYPEKPATASTCRRRDFFLHLLSCAFLNKSASCCSEFLFILIFQLNSIILHFCLEKKKEPFFGCT